MGELADRVINNVNEVLAPSWDIVDGRAVPESVSPVTKAVKLNATYVYADMADSTGLAQHYTKRQTAKVIRSYLNAATTILKAKGGEIRGFDGDRVLAIFIGNSKNSNAVVAAANVQWAVQEFMKDRFKEKWSSFTWDLKQGIGIDTGEAFLVQGGVRGDNDLVSIGSAPNVAAKLSAVRDGHAIHMTSAVFNMLNEEAMYSVDKSYIPWKDQGSVQFGGKDYRYYASSYWRRP